MQKKNDWLTEIGRKKSHSRQRHRWKNNTEMGLQEGGAYCTELSGERDGPMTGFKPRLFLTI